MDEISIDSRWNPSTGQYPPIFSDYYPFGGIISEADPFGGTTQLPPIEQAFTGKERDTESGNDYFGARYYASTMGRMLSPDSGVDQHPEDPQSWNLYSYVRNNPLNGVDPTGEFTCDSKTVSATQCENAHQSDDKARAALGAIKDKYGADSSQYKDALRASDALGGRKDNGVVLAIGNAGKDADGNVTIGPMQAKTDDNPNGQNIKVTLSAGDFDGSAGAAVGIEHEGSHVADAHDWINSGFSPKGSVNWYQSEFRAYSVEGNLATAMGITLQFHGGREIMGAGALNSQNFQGFMINSILRQSPYHLNPSSKLTLWQDHTRGGH
jgi:RHS repeat-associated protein